MATEEKKKNKKSAMIEKVKDIDSSFLVLEECLNGLSQMAGLSKIDKASYQKAVRSKIESKTFKSTEEKTIWEHRQMNHFQGEALRNCLVALMAEFSKREERVRKVEGGALLFESIQNKFQVIQKNLKSSIGLREKELIETQEILEQKERLLAAQKALDIKSGLKDDETARKMKILSGMREEAIHTNISSIQAMEEIMGSMGELERMSGLSSLIHAYYSSYKRSAAIFLLVLGLFSAGIGFYYYSSRQKPSSPSLEKIQQETKETQGAPLERKEEEVEKKPLPPMPEGEPEADLMKEEPLPQEAAKERELSADEAFEKKLMEQTVPFVPNCENNYVVLVEGSLGGGLDLVERDARYFLMSQKFPVKERHIEIIKTRDAQEMAMALKNGAINSPYCIDGKIYLPQSIGFDLIEFPVLLPYGVDPKAYEAQFIIKEQLEFAKEKMGKSYLYLRPRIFPAGSAKAGEGSEADYNAAVEEYWKHYRRIKWKAEGKPPEKK